MDRWWRSPRCGVVALQATVLLAGCTDSRNARVGVVLGDEGVRAAKVAVEELNADGGRPIALRVLTGAFGSSAQIALQGAESLAADPNVLGVVGHANSSASLAASQVYNARRVVQLAPTTTSPLYSQAGPYSYRLAASDAHQARFLAEQIGKPEAQHIAVVYANDDYGRSLRRLFLDELSNRGLRPVYQGAYAESEADGAEMVRALAASHPTLLVWLGRDPFFSRIAANMRAALPTLRVLASDGFGGVAVQRDTGGVFDGVRYVRLVNLQGGSPALRRLQDRYRAEGGGEMTDQAVLSYDAVKLLGTAIREAGPDREAIRLWMDALGRSRPAFVGVSGPISFSAEGDRAPTYVLVSAGAGARTPMQR